MAVVKDKGVEISEKVIAFMKATLYCHFPVTRRPSLLAAPPIRAPAAEMKNVKS